MSNLIDIAVKFFAMIGVLAITGVGLYYIITAIQEYTPPSAPLWPNQEYMEKIGAVCPTGWVYQGSANGKDNCVNKYQVPVNPEDASCYNDGDNANKFKSINNWEDCVNDPMNCSGLQDRCGWMTKCGINGAKAPWINVSDKC